MSEVQPVQEPRILQFIKDAIADPEEKEYVSVLPLMCGTGKSTSISYLIKEAIEKNEGLLVMTDRTHRLEHGYLNPRDTDLKAFLDEHRDKITVLKQGTREEAFKTKFDTPVLLMTTQRYFSASRDFIIREYLTWKEGTRKTVIIDEKPELYTQQTLNLESLNRFEERLAEELSCIEDNTEIEEFLQIRHWEEIKDIFLRRIVKYRRMMKGRDSGYFYVHPRVSEDEIKAISELDNVPDEGEDEAETKIFRDYKTIMQMKKDYVLRSTELNNLIIENMPSFQRRYMDIYKIYRMYRYMDIYGALYGFRASSTGQYENAFTVLMNNKYKLIDIGAKVVVLDGTAELSMDYRQDYLHFKDCSDFDRELPQLHVKMVNLPGSSKANLTKRLEDENFRNSIISYVRKHSENDECVYFTYKDVADLFAEETDDEEKNENKKMESSGYFGNLRGRNDFINSTCFAQIGVLRCPENYYLGRQMDQMDEDVVECAPNADFQSVEELLEYTNNVKKQDGYEAKMWSDMLADIEQNIFRGPIRIDGDTRPVTYYIFIDFDTNKKLIKQLIERFQDGYCATVEFDRNPEDLELSKILSRQSEKESAAQQIIRYIQSLPKKTDITKKMILQNCGIRDITYNNALRDNSKLRTWLTELHKNYCNETEKKTPGHYMLI